MGRKKLRHLLSNAVKSLASAAELAVKLNESEVAGELDKLKEEARLVTAKVDAEFAGGADGAPFEEPCQP